MLHAGQAKHALFKQLRQGGKCRRNRTYGIENKWELGGKPMIDSRPAAVEERQEIGHWGGDTVMGPSRERPRFLTLVERSTGYVCAVRLPGNPPTN